MKYKDIDPSILNKPAIEVMASKMSSQDQGIPIKSPDEALTEEQTGVGTDTTQTSEEESKVPYSRFKKFHDQAKESAEEADYWKREAERLQQEHATPRYQIPNAQASTSYEGADWERFKSLYAGADENLVKEAYKLETERIAGVEERAVQRALERVEGRERAVEEAQQENLNVINEGLETASDILGRQLTADEELALLDIQDDYSPKDRSGKIEALLPMEKALEIYQMQTRSNPRREARNQIAALSTPTTTGDTSTETKDTNWKPGSWRQNFERRFGRKA